MIFRLGRRRFFLLCCCVPCPRGVKKDLPVGLGDTLELVLLLDGVRVAGALGGVDELLGQALGDGLDVAEGGLAGAGGQQGDGLVDAAEGRHIDGLATDGAGGADTGGVLAGSAVDDGVDGDLDGVLVGHEVDLWEGMCVSWVVVAARCWVWVGRGVWSCKSAWNLRSQRRGR